MITFTETLIVLDIIKTKSNNCFIVPLDEKERSHVFATSPEGKQHKAREFHDYPKKSCIAVIHDMITRDLECP